MMTVRDLVQDRSISTIDRNATVQAAAEFIAVKNIGAVAVMDGPLLVGIFPNAT